jgi:hypothetical protein
MPNDDWTAAMRAKAAADAETPPNYELVENEPTREEKMAMLQKQADEKQKMLQRMRRV